MTVTATTTAAATAETAAYPTDSALFSAILRQRNTSSLQLAVVLGSLLVPAFWWLDWFVVPDQLAVTAALRLSCTLYGVLLLLLSLRRREWVARHSTLLTISYMLSVHWSIAVMCWLQGYESAYYAGLNLVIVAAGFLYSWPIRLALLFHGLAYGFYMFPLAVGAIGVADFPAVMGNQAFLLAMTVISIAAQQHRFRLERREFSGTLALQRTKVSLEEAYGKLKQVDRAKNHFFNNITHELRTPLTMILSPLESLLADEIGAPNPEQRRFLQTIHSSALKLLKLINDLLDLARLEEDFLRLQLRRDDLTALLRHLAEYARPLAARKQIAVELEVRARPVDLHVDPEKMERVFVNLLANALKFCDVGGRVAITLDVDADDEDPTAAGARAASSGEVRICVADTGIGIPAEKLESIFERFSQSDASITRRYGGTGIGLAFAQEIVALHGGRITVDSVEGQGSTFVVHLRQGTGHLDPAAVVATGGNDADRAERDAATSPEWTQLLQQREQYRFLDLEAATERRIAERSADSDKSTKVLVVEDTLDVLRFVNMLLSSSHSVYLAQDGRQGLELARRELPDVVVTDYMMPEMDGVTLIRELRADPQTAEIPVIMLTAKKTVEDRLAARQQGADIYLAKPFSPRELRAAVVQLLERRGRQTSHLMRVQVRSLETICAGLSHEIKNPLSYIGNSHLVIAEKVGALLEIVGTVADRLEPADRQRADRAAQRIERMVAAAETGVERINRIVDVVRRYSREGYPSELSALPVDRAIEDVVRLVAPRDNQEVELELDLQAGDACVRCVPEEMQQVFGNLSQNAIDAVAARGRVSIRTRADNGQVLIEVADDGAGISAEDLPRIFTPFFSTKDPGKGMGLGLAIAHQVVSASGGSIAVDSTPGRGTTFRVQLPLADRPVRSAAGLPQNRRD